ncbi:MAG: glycoside hydrolase family 2 protein [Kiritimatiellia bacterium]
MKNILFAFCVVALAGGLRSEIPLPEHPRPDWERALWMNLNGSWRFAFDGRDVGEKEQWFTAADDAFDKSITVPFPWGSRLSGVGDEADVGWYRRDVTVPAEWKGKRVFLVIGASDHDTTCWFDGNRLGAHSGGYTPFEFELTDHVNWGSPQKITLRAWDAPAELSRRDWRLYGKQGYGNARGVWQTVYLEARGADYLEKVHFTPDIENGLVTADVRLGAPAKKPLTFQVQFREDDRAKPAVVQFVPGQMSARVRIPLRNVKLWDLDNPYLYEVKVVLEGEGTADAVSTYFGMRKVAVGKLPGSDVPYVTLNGKPIYLQLTLDQSYHPDGFYTFPSDAFMKNEIMISKNLALSGNRIHIKVEIPRKLYWADRLGLLIMADVPCAWGPASEAMFREHWFCFEDMVARDFNHPSIFSWVLFNETWGLFADGENWGANRANRYAPWVRRRVADAYAKAKALDPTRLVEDNSPCNRDHVITDINTWHGYLPGYGWENEVERQCKSTFPGSTHNYIGGYVQNGAPMFNSECGNVWGYKGSTGDCDWSWDYHMMMNAFRRRLACGGWLYTEHHDVINEWNGYVRFDRTEKFTGVEELVPGSSLKDWHADAYLPLDRELFRAFGAGETWTMPVDVSLTTDKYTGKRLTVFSWIRSWNAKGRLTESAPAEAGSFTASSWQNGRVLDVPVALPDETASGVICFELKDGDTVVARNFACFATKGKAPDNVVSVKPGAFSKASWSQKQWNIFDGEKANGAGKGFFEYAFAGVPAGRKATFRAEVSAKRLNAKDTKDLDKGVRDLDCMLGGGFADRSKNPNSYPMTCAEKWSGTLSVYANGELVKTMVLPDDPADHRGILSWAAQQRPEMRKSRTLNEAGSYGYLVEAEIAPEILAKGDGKVVVRLETDEHGLAVYGADFGRYPLDPSVEF